MTRVCTLNPRYHIRDIEWQEWNTLSSSVYFSAGTHSLRIEYFGNNFNINWFEIENSSSSEKNISSINDAVATDIQVTLFPVPVQNALNVSIPDFETYTGLDIVDFRGSVMQSSSINQANTQVDVSNLPSGLHLISLHKGDNISKTIKFVK